MISDKGKIGFTAGNFDLIHPGYIYTFEAAKKQCDYFILTKAAPCFAFVLNF